MNKQRLLQLLTKSLMALVVMFAFMATTASAQTIFVSASSGNDAFDGTSSNVQSGLVGPKRTIAAAITAAGAGGTISIEAGTYAEDVTVTTDLTVLTTASGANTTVTVGTGGGNAMVLGDDTTDDITLTGGGSVITTTGVEGIVFQHGNIAIGAGALRVPAGAPVTVTDARITGSAPAFLGTSAFTYNGTTTTARTVGVEFPATVGLLTISTTEPTTFPGGFTAAGITHSSVASGDVTFQGNVTSSALVTTTGAGDMTFDGTLTSTFANATAVNVADGVFTAANVVLDDLGGLVVALGETATISGQLTLQADIDNAPSGTRIDNDGSLTIGSIVLSNNDTTIGVGTGPLTDTHVIDNDSGSLTIGSVSEDNDQSTTAGALAADDILAIFSFTNDTGTARTTFTNAVTISGPVVNSVAAANGIHFNGGGTLGNNLTNTGGILIGAGNTLDLTWDVGPFGGVADVNGSGTLLISGDANVPAGGIDADGNVTVSGDSDNAGSTAVDGNFTVTGDADFAGAVVVGGNMSVASDGSLFGAAVTVAGNATLDADANGGDGPDFAGSLSVSGLLTVSDDTDVAGNFTAGNVTVSGNEPFNLTSVAGTHNVSGTVTVNGTSSVVLAAGASTFTADATSIDQNALIDLNAGNTYVSQGDFTGGMFDGTGAGATLQFDLPAAGATFSPGPNTQVTDFRVQGNERTLILLQSFEVQNDYFVADDATMSLTNRLVRMTGVTDGTGLVEIATDASITATDISGAISFEGGAGALFTISSDVLNQDVGTLTNLVIASAAVGPANKVTVDEDVTITGVINLVEGGLTVQAAPARTMTFSGNSAGISRNVGGNNTTITGTTAGIYDLTYTGVGPAANGAEFVDPGTNVIDDLTVNTTGGAMTLTPAVGINGNFTVGSASVATIVGGLTVGGNMTVNAVTATDGTVNGAGTVTLAGAGATHTVSGTVIAPVVFAANATMNGNASDNVESNISNATVNTGAAVTIAGLQEILGDVTVNGALTLGLTDADGVGVDDQDIEGDVFIDEAGSLTLTSNVSVGGAGLAPTGIAVGNGGAGSAALDLGGNTLTLSTPVSSFTADADAIIGSTGTIRVAAATTIGSDNTGSGTARAMLPTVNIDAVGASLSSDIGVAGTFDFDEDFTIGAFDIWLSGDATFVDTAGDTQLDIIGSTGRFITLGTTLTMAEDVSVPNFMLNSSGTTTLAENGAAASYDFHVTNAGASTGTVVFQTGTLDLGGQDFVVADLDGTDESLIDYNGGTITGAGRLVIEDDNDGLGGVDTDTASNMTVPNLRVQVGLVDAVAGDANDGLDMSASDAITVTGTLELDGGTIFIDNGATLDGTFTIADGARIIRDFGVFDATAGTVGPVFGGNGISVEYDDAVTTGRELPGTVAELQLDAAIIMADDVDLTVTTLDINAAGSNLDIDGDNGTVVTITDGGVVQLSHGAGTPFTTGAGAAGSDDGEISYAGAYSLLVDGTSTSSAQVWQGSPSSVTVSGGGGVTLTLGSAHTAADVTVGAGETLAMGANNLTVTGNLTQNGAVTSAGGTLAFAGTAAQTFTLPAGGNTLPNVTFNNAAGVDLSGGNLNVTTLATFTSGNVRTGATNALVLNHTSTGVQNFVQTAGGVVGNVRKFIVGGALGAAADRMTFPTAASTGAARPVSITFNQPNQIGATGAATVAGFNGDTGISLTINHVEASPGGNNNMPLTTTDNLGQDLTIARYPDFHWLITANSTLSPSVDYDIELDGAGFAQFAGEDIERTRTIRRQGGASTNFWTLVGPTAGANDNFAVSATNPVTVVRNAVGALNAGNGVLFTMGLESNMTVTNPAAVSVNAGATGTVDLTTVFGGGTGAYSYAVTSGDATVATGAAAANTLTVTGVAAGATTLTVVATDILNDTRTATVSVTVNPALAAGTVDAVALNAGGTSTLDLSTVFTGGADPVTYVVASDDAAVATGAEATGTLTITAVAAGTATVSVTATDGTGQTATATVAVSVNAALAVTNPATITLLEGASSTVDLSTVFAGGDGTYTYTVTSAAAANVTGAEASGTLTVTAVEAYAAGTTIGTTNVTVVATDGIGDSVTATVVVDVLPVLGDLDGSGAPSAASASLALDYFLGLTTLTAKQQTAADFNGDGFVTPFDAALIFDAFFNGKTEIAAYVASDLTFGELVRETGMVSIPVQLTGNLNEVVSASFSAQIDPAFATVESVVSELGEGWIVKHVVSEDGQLRIAIAGFGEIEADGVVATINLQLVDSAPAFNLSAEGAVNNNPVANIDAVEVVELPETFALQGNYPNPFNPSTTVQFDLPETADVEIQIFDMLGRQVMALPSQTIQAGAKRSVQLNASQLASGSYFYRVIAKMESKTLVESGRMMLVK